MNIELESTTETWELPNIWTHNYEKNPRNLALQSLEETLATLQKEWIATYWNLIPKTKSVCEHKRRRENFTKSHIDLFKTTWEKSSSRGCNIMRRYFKSSKNKEDESQRTLRNHEGLCMKEEVPSRKKLGKGILQEPVDFKFVSFIRMVHIWDRMWMNFLRKKRREISSHNKAVCLLQYIFWGQFCDVAKVVINYRKII